MAAFLRPDADSLDGNWTNESGNNTNLFASLRETSASDAEYIQSPVDPAAEVCRIALSNPTGVVQQPFTLSYRFQNLNGGLLTVRLLQGATVIASWDETASGWTTQDRTLTGPQFAAITDFTNLFVEFEANGGAPGEIDLDFTAGVLDSRITFSRASTATYINSSGLVASAATNAPRFDYHPVALSPRGLLIEEQRTNYIVHSNNFADTAWYKGTGTSVSAQDAVGPDGAANSAWSVTIGSGGGGLYQGATGVQGVFPATGSVWLRAKSGTPQVYLEWGGHGGEVLATLSTAWQRFTAPKPNLAAYYFVIRTDWPTILGSPTIEICNIQAEIGAFPTSYIPTTTAAATRAVDNASMTGTNFSSWFTNAQGTFVCEFESQDMQRSWCPIINLYNSGSAATTSLFIGSDIGAARAQVTDASAAQAYFSLGALSPGVFTKVALAYAVNDFAGCQDGATVQTDTSGSVPTLDILTLGADQWGRQLTGGHIKSVQFYSTRKTNAELQELTQQPALDLDFAAGVLDSRIFLNRSSTASYYAASGSVATAAVNGPRFDHDPVTHVPRGLLIEEQRTNLVIQSGDIGNAAWAGYVDATGSVSRVSNSGVAPDGNNTATLVTINRSDPTHWAQGSAGNFTSAGGFYTASLWIKAYQPADVGKTIDIALYDGGSAAYITTITLTADWVRYTKSATLAAAAAQFLVGYFSVTFASFLTATSAIGQARYLAWGGQVEAGAFATSYIPTAATTVTRGADIPGTNDISWFATEPAGGTVICEAMTMADHIANDNSRLWDINSGEYSYSFYVSAASSSQGNQLQFNVYDSGGALQAAINAGAPITPLTPFKVGTAWGINDCAAVRDGGAVATDTTVNFTATRTNLRLGHYITQGPYWLNGWIKRWTYYAERKPNAELQELTS